ncbi:MAG: hypothetical protein A2219_03710 [Elusimicrobia bacterium RIFOXYA2_FULL_50_26]|nr:MAG: hypothetical protein A2219_03710 [Elusimicrobia bacterium RIFOXYA2_FULL_50_26]OGS24098.1 MAG: hypothetical protein A2314_02955 [Elusimicrobia bacterium RIFOXYB2_FULL_50_12]
MNKIWFSTWKKAHEELAKIKARELREFDYEKNQKIIDDMLEAALMNPRRTTGTGLVIQQRLFRKLVNK